MSNYNRAYTPKNIVNSFNEADIVEPIDTTNNIWYVKTNGHEYLVDAGRATRYISTSNSSTPKNVRFRSIFEGTNQVDLLYQLNQPPTFLTEAMLTGIPQQSDRIDDVSANFDADDRSLSKINLCLNTRFQLHQYYQFDQLNSETLKFISGPKLGIQPIISSTYCKLSNIKSGTSLSGTQFPSDYKTLCDGLNFNWGLPNVEILTAIGSNLSIFSSIIKSTGHAVDWNEYNRDFIFGFHLPLFTHNISDYVGNELQQTKIQSYKVFIRVKSTGLTDSGVTGISGVSGSSNDPQTSLRDDTNGADLLYTDSDGSVSGGTYTIKTYGWYEKNYSIARIEASDTGKSDDWYCFQPRAQVYIRIPMITLPVATLR